MRAELPAGRVTFLLTDVEGSTRLLHELGAEGYAAALAEHRQSLREAFRTWGGVEVDTQGDAFFFAFGDPAAAVSAAAAGQEALAGGRIRVRMGLHTGRPLRTDEGYVGADLHLAARIAAAGHGGQVLLSADTRRECELEVTYLGEHRLKDFAGPVAVYQLGTEAFPPLKTISNTNLPRPASSFVGREREVEEVASLLRGRDRLISLTGPGGSGKTRLAIEAAAELVGELKAGVFWVGLAPLRDPALVVATVEQTLGAKGALAEHIGDRELLLLLDNFEQVVGAAPELPKLLESCPNLKLLVTSRERLRVRGEVEYSVPPLSDPEAVDLFCRRAQVAPDESVRELCRRLDKLPLALELAAARGSLLTPVQMLERIGRRLDDLKGGRDAETRQRTLRATIEWSHDLLAEDERRLFRRLAVFAGGCSLESAEQIAEAELDLLQSLVDKSLVRQAAGRFSMLETIREFALERLEQSGEAGEVRARHAEHFGALGREAEKHLRDDAPEWANRLQGEQDNLRAALDHLEETGRSEELLEIAGSIYRFWYLKSHFTEGLGRLERALELNTGPTSGRAKALLGSSVMALNLRRLDLARRRAEEALELSRDLGDEPGVAYSTMMIGNSLSEGGELAASVPYLREAVDRQRALGETHYALVASLNLGWVLEELGDLEGARAIHEEILRHARVAGKQRMVAYALGQLSIMERDAGRLEVAAAMLREAIGICHASLDVANLAIDLGRLASVLVRQEQPAVAALLVSVSEAVTASLGIQTPWWAERRNGETRELTRARLGDEAYEAAAEQGRRLGLDQAVALALGSPAPAG